VPRSQQRVQLQTMRTTDTINLNSGQAYFGLSASPVEDLNTLMVSAANWAPLANIYDEFRVTSVKYKYVPDKMYSTVQGYAVPAIISFDVDGLVPGAPALAYVAQYGTGKAVNLNEEFEITWDIPEDAKQKFFDMSNTATWKPQICIHTLTGTSNTYTTGMVYAEFAVQMRGVR